MSVSPQQPNLYRRLRHWGKQIGLRRVVDLVRRRESWSSDWKAIGFARDLHIPFDPPMAKIPITVQLLTADLADRMFDLTAPGISADEHQLRKSRGELWAAGIGTGYVAVTESGETAYCQWL
ncbi:MAG TPA: hypothetical protein PK691_11655, partial [Thermomicrobiales bacterium]|nr:hypothetical protein [Thermomicrobiales bacterium]